MYQINKHSLKKNFDVVTSYSRLVMDPVSIVDAPRKAAETFVYINPECVNDGVSTTKYDVYTFVLFC